QISSQGYVRFLLTNKKGFTLKVYSHRLVAEAFINNPENKPEVNHINAVKSDNRVENLEWCTRYENIEHSIKNDLFRSHIPKTRLKKEDVLFIREKAYDITQKELSNMFNVSIAAIRNVVSR